jgi:two-component system response regulator FixJ
MSRSYSIAIVDDNDAVRTSMARLLESEGHQLLSFASGDSFLEAGLPDQLNCILLDMQMPGKNGLEVLRVIGERSHRPAVLVMTGHGDIPMAVEAMKLGAFDFLQKPFASASLLAAVESASEYHLYSRASLTGNREAVALVETLSERQRQVLAGIVKGRPNKLIAYDLGLSIRTVEAYRAQTLVKLGVHSTAEAVRIAIAAATVGNAFGWVGPGPGPDSLIHGRTTDCISAHVAPGAVRRGERVEAVLLD